MISDKNFRFERPCEQCGTPVRAYYKSQLKRFCCIACANQWKWDNLDRKRVEYVTVKCSFCGKEKQINKTDHRLRVGQPLWFCDHNCEREYRHLYRTNKTCPICGKVFCTQTQRTKTCGAECGCKMRTVSMYNLRHGTSYSWREYAQRKEAVTLESFITKERTTIGIYAGREKEYMREYCQRPENKKRAQEALRRRMDNDPVYAFKINIRKKISGYIKYRRVKKDVHTEEILGCTLEQFMTHLESQFQKGMTWANYGKWEVDHIIPLSTANTKEEVYCLNHYTNLRPLWRKDNLEKRDKIIQVQLKLPINLI